MNITKALAAFDAVVESILHDDRTGHSPDIPDYVFCDKWNDLPVELKIKNAQWLQELGAALEKDPQIKAWFKENR